MTQAHLGVIQDDALCRGDGKHHAVWQLHRPLAIRVAAKSTFLVISWLCCGCVCPAGSSCWSSCGCVSWLGWPQR